jgi:coenzyme F420-reducing hydrogenase alpha subunit
MKLNKKMKQQSGKMIHDEDLMQIKVFLRTYNDAISCAQHIAKRENQRDHYKSYMKTLIRSLRDDKVRDIGPQHADDD